MTFFTKEQIANYAWNNSPFYQELYNCDENKLPEFEKLPIVTRASVTKIAMGSRESFFAGKEISGICCTSSGTAGIATLTKLDRSEWRETKHLIAVQHMNEGLLKDGDIVANITFSGHTSVLLVHDVLNFYPGPITEVVIGADQDLAVIYDLCERFQVNVITAVYSTVIALADWIVENGLENKKIRRVLGGGEMLYGSQRDLLNKAFPRVKIQSFLYGSTDSGNIGHNLRDEDDNIFKVFQSASCVEILDRESFEKIERPGKKGLIAVTNLLRLNAPVVRYCNGDLAEWIESPNAGSAGGKLRLLGRDYPVIDFEGLAISGRDVMRVVESTNDRVSILRIQVELDNKDGRLSFGIFFTAYRPSLSRQECEQIIRKTFIESVSGLSDLITRCERGLFAKCIPLRDFSSTSRKRGKILVDNRIN